MGANPSRREFLQVGAEEALHLLDSGQSLPYLDGKSARFRLLNPWEDLDDILRDDNLQNEVIQSYYDYFSTNPYGWFGTPGGYRVEAFVNGFGASYFSHEQFAPALHIDLFPFVTLQDFTALQSEILEHIFVSGWAAEFFQELVSFIHPRAIIIFGKTNVEYFSRYIETCFSGEVLYYNSNRRAGFRLATSRVGLPLVGLNVNLGNPVGFSTESLRSFGNHVADVVRTQVLSE